MPLSKIDIAVIETEFAIIKAQLDAILTTYTYAELLERVKS